MRKANAYFGIKANSAWKGKVYSSATQECYDGVNMTTVTALFRAYDSLEESVIDHGNLLSTTSRYKNLINETNYKTACINIQADGYATDPQYSAKLISLIEQYNLTQYDVEDNQEEGGDVLSYTYDINWTTNNRYWNLPDMNVAGIILHSIGTPQESADVLRNNFNKSTTLASIHGFVEPNRFVECAPCKEVKRKAKKCYHAGSGVKGRRDSTHIGIEMCEPNTIEYTGGATFTDKNPAHSLKYVQQVTQTAAELCADLCIFHGLSPTSITTHRQSYLDGYASNHGDPEHLWNQTNSGYTLATFREKVQEIINSKGDVLANMTKDEFDKALAAIVPKVYATQKDIPTWYSAAVTKAVNLGIVQGTGTSESGETLLNLSEDLCRTLTVLDRLGLIKKGE